MFNWKNLDDFTTGVTIKNLYRKHVICGIKTKSNTFVHAIMNIKKIMLESIKSGSTLKKMLPVFKNDYKQSLNIIHFRQLGDVSTAPGYYNIGISNC